MILQPFDTNFFELQQVIDWLSIINTNCYASQLKYVFWLEENTSHPPSL